jgi:hypothetical protein
MHSLPKEVEMDNSFFYGVAYALLIETIVGLVAYIAYRLWLVW